MNGSFSRAMSEKKCQAVQLVRPGSRVRPEIGGENS